MLSSSGTERQSFANLFLDQTRLAEGLPAAACDIDRIVDVAIVIPFYKGRETIEELCDRLVLSPSRITQVFSIVLVDDRSKDNVWPVIVARGKRDARIHGIQLSQIFGQHCALTAGIDHVRAR